jgi:hypothetical protein
VAGGAAPDRIPRFLLLDFIRRKRIHRAIPRPAATRALPPLAGDARMRRPSPIIHVPRTANAPQSGLSLGCPEAIEEGEEAVGRNQNTVSDCLVLSYVSLLCR